jgi:hypothetical protein
MMVPLLPPRQQAPQPSKEELRAQAAAAVTKWIEENGRQPSERSKALAERVKVAEFWKNRSGESIRATLLNYKGRDCFDLRQYFTRPDGRMQPTREGIMIAVLRLPELAAAVNKALVRARELGLLAPDTTGGAA